MKYYTPAPGRTPERWVAPRGNITNREDYKLDVKLKEFRQNQYVLTIERFLPEHGWSTEQYFIDPEELARIQDILSLNN
jgi:hypothetical protein